MTVNTAPERAKRVIGAMVKNLKESYIIDYVVNSESKSLPWLDRFKKFLVSRWTSGKDERLIALGSGVEDVGPLIKQHRPDVLVSHNSIVRMQPSVFTF